MSIHSGEDVGAFVSGFPPVLIMGLIIRHHLHEVLFSNLIYHLINYCKLDLDSRRWHQWTYEKLTLCCNIRGN